MSPRRSRTVVVLGMLTKMPVPGVLWQTLHYLVGLRRLGYDVIYVEAHARTPSMFTEGPGDPGSATAARFIHELLDPFGLGTCWAFHALHDDGACYGLTRDQLSRAYRSAEILINLHGGTRPRPEHADTGRLVFLGTDPCQLEVELWQGREETYDFLEAHCAVFTFGENYGKPGCGLPVSDRYELWPTRQPVVPDFWEAEGAAGRLYSTVANWRQPFRKFRYLKETYHWSKDLEFRKFADLPTRSGLGFELALSSFDDEDRSFLESHGWQVREAAEFSTELHPYRDFIRSSRGEFTVAKDQNVRLKSGWFSDRSATYLAAGRPVITQDTGFGSVLPTGEGLFPFDDMEGALAALETIEEDHPAACRAAQAISREYFDYRVVLPALLTRLGVEGPCTVLPVGRIQEDRVPGDGESEDASAPDETPADTTSFPEDLILEPVSRRPIKLVAETRDWIMGRSPPEGRAVGSLTPGEAKSASIVVVTYENLAFTRLCLETLLAHTDHPFYEVVVVDNGSSDRTPVYLRELAARDPRVRLILNPSNEGFARACNQGARASSGDIIVFLNNDTVLPTGWLAGLAWHLDQPGVGAINPVTNRIGTEAEVGESPRTLGEFLRRAEERRSEEPALRQVTMLALFCLALKRETWEAVGPLDEGFGRGLFEDDDYSVRLKRAGFGLWCAEDVFVYHFGEASFGRLVPDGTYGRLFEGNRRLFEAKWGETWSPHRTRSDHAYHGLVESIRERLNSSLPAGATVAVISRGDPQLLELGSATGWHFPRQPDGTWAGHYPADGDEAVAHLQALQRRGADHLLIPQPAFWWLDHYRALERHLLSTGEEVMRTEDLRLYRLTPSDEADHEPRPVLIIGSPRSGTSILTWSLGQHPNLYPLEETVWFGRFHAGLSQAFRLGSSRKDKSQLSAMGIGREEFITTFGRTVDDLIRRHRVWPKVPLGKKLAFARARSPEDPKERWVDGTPENSFHVPGIAEMFPEARFIHLLRESAPVVRSLCGFHRIGGRKHTPDEAYQRWLRHVRACRQAEQELGPDRILRVLHRDLSSDPRSVVAACLEFLGETYSEDCLLPLSSRINSSAPLPSTADPLGNPDDVDPELVGEAQALEEELFELQGAPQ